MATSRQPLFARAVLSHLPRRPIAVCEVGTIFDRCPSKQNLTRPAKGSPRWPGYLAEAPPIGAEVIQTTPRDTEDSLGAALD